MCFRLRNDSFCDVNQADAEASGYAEIEEPQNKEADVDDIELTAYQRPTENEHQVNSLLITCH